MKGSNPMSRIFTKDIVVENKTEPHRWTVGQVLADKSQPRRPIGPLPHLPNLEALLNDDHQAADSSLVSSQPIERLDGTPQGRQAHLGVERVDGNRVAAEIQRQAEAAQRHGASGDVVVERVTGEPESR
jgi:hypothetical protein